MTTPTLSIDFKKLRQLKTKVIDGYTHFVFKEPRLFIRTVAGNMTSSRARNALGSQLNTWFKYPTSGQVICRDWVKNDQCGHGIHGCLLEHSGYNFIDYGPSKWLIMESEADEMVHISDKIKVPRANVLKVGANKSDACRKLASCVSVRLKHIMGRM